MDALDRVRRYVRTTVQRFENAHRLDAGFGAIRAKAGRRSRRARIWLALSASLPGMAFAPRASGPALEFPTPLPPEAASSLAMALILSSHAPILLLDEDLTILAASGSFCETFGIDPHAVNGNPLSGLGGGEWNSPQLGALLRATIAGHAAIDAYEMDLAREGRETRHLVLGARKLEHSDAGDVRIVLTVTDVTEARLAEKMKDDLLRERQILLQELQHRVANSLQIIASVLLQSAREVQSKETRIHLHDAHNRVMSIAMMQKQLAVSRQSEVELRPYFTDLCRSIGASMIADHNRLSLNATVDDTVTEAQISVSLGLIVTELVINALKHAFPGHDRKGRIDVGYSSEGKAWTLTVADDGIGMPADPAGVKPGLGTGIVEALSRQLNAIVHIADAAPGTRVSIVYA
jgi:two-component sensor histidine kinase/PAS domain-containing protein